MLHVHNFTAFINKHHLFTPNQRVLAAISGGRDSVLLAHLLKQAGYSFGIMHCNFSLRAGEADAEQQFTAGLAASLQVPFYTTTFDTGAYGKKKGISTQMAARELRYQWFEQVRHEHGFDCIATAHHLNDAVETVLLNLTRGTGIAGMHGILPKNGLIVRPLLFLNRDDVDTIIQEENLDFMEDSSNASAKYGRNKIRLEVVPRLKELNPSLEDTFDKNLSRFRDLETLLNNHLETLRKQLLLPYNDDIQINITAIKRLGPQRLLLFGLLNPYGFSEQVIGDLINSLDKHPGRRFESPGYSLITDRDKLILSKRGNMPPEPVLINHDDHAIHYGTYKLILLHDGSPLVVKDNPMAFSADADELVFPLTTRSWQQGDHFYPLGMQGRKKLSDFFISEKVPLNQKQKIPVLVNGNGDVIWVCGYRPDDRYKVTAYTKKVIIFELYKLNL